MLIRPAIVSDIPAVQQMVAKICALHESWDPAKFGFLPHPEQRYERWLAGRVKDARSVFLVAEAPSPSPSFPIAFLVATVESEIPIYQTREYGFVHDLWVEPDYRQTGVARQMVQITIERFQQLGVKQVRLDTAAANEVARHLFAACGFRVSTIEMLLELDPGPETVKNAQANLEKS